MDLSLRLLWVVASNGSRFVITLPDVPVEVLVDATLSSLLTL